MLLITILLTLFFVFASSIKLIGWQKLIFETQLQFFNKYGLNRIHMFLIGLLELVAAILLLVTIFISNQQLNAMGAALIAFTSIGAIYFHLKYDTFKDAIPALITLILASTLILDSGLVIKLWTIFIS
ncbi:DoxX family protein [Pseudoalteromonas luteoviolacea]|uniref:DoxX family protein n=1 Tax=Pseudoalteromonas luteoviolacea TaxID=43657 RepID=UPI001B385BB6|nr:DoxX family protein [Pseudoalteromonas luteoviolacea]MBQ4811416.1 DoxX family protein [Pseudoalteromonas luteoviolacea]